ALALATYSRTDPGWSFSGAGSALQNKGGAFGAWLADLLFYLFGLSAWWWVIGCIGFVVAGYRALTRPEASDRVLWLTLLGFALVLAASCGVEALRLYHLGATLPLGAGGLAGTALGAAVAQLLGFNGGTLILLLVLAAGWALFSGMSWLKLMEQIGVGVERV